MRSQFIRSCVAVMAIPFCSMAYAHPGHGIDGMASWHFGIGLALTTVSLLSLGLVLGGRLYKKALVAANGAFPVAANW